MTTNLIPTKKNDFESYYKKTFKRAKDLNNELTELEYIQSEIDSLLPTVRETKQQNLIEYIQYLSYYTSEVKWELKDYLNNYLKTKSIRNCSFLLSQEEDFDELVNKLKIIKFRFEYIYKNLHTTIDKNRLKDDYFDFLNRIPKLNNQTKYKTLIDNHKLEIEKKLDTQISSTDISKEQIEVESKEKHNSIFSDNNFEVWERLYDELGVTESSRTDLRFMYEVMKAKSQILDTVRLIDYTNWINKVKNWEIDKLQYTNYKGKSNSHRYSIYKTICDNNKLGRNT